MTASANDAYFNLREQLRSLDEDEAVALACSLIDQQCGELDAQYLKLVITATGSASQDLTRDYAVRGSPAAQLEPILIGEFSGRFSVQASF